MELVWLLHQSFLEIVRRLDGGIGVSQLPWGFNWSRGGDG